MSIWRGEARPKQDKLVGVRSEGGEAKQRGGLYCSDEGDNAKMQRVGKRKLQRSFRVATLGCGG